MALKKRKARRRASITSLIDVIFLLLLFFMLSSTFSRFSEVEIAAVEASGGGAASERSVSMLRINQKNVALDASAVSDDALIAALRTLKTSGTTALAIMPEDGVTTQRLIDVLGIVTQVSDLDIRVVGPAA
ncbi:MAG: biopolymer transporter ExbD [Pseudomonadota bacterium]